MQALAPGRLAKTGQPQAFQPLAQFDGRFNHPSKRHVGRRVEVEHQSAREVRIIRLAVPRMQFDSTELGKRGKPFDPVDLKIGLAISRNSHEFEQIGRAWHGVALEELVAADSVRRAYDRAGAPLDVLDHPVAHRLVVEGKVLFGDRRVLVGP